MATRKITRKVKVVEPDLTNPTHTHEWSVEDNTNYASINDFYLTYNNVNYYFTKPNTIEIGDKFYFNINTKILKLNEDTISTSTTGSSNNELIFVPSHKWSDEYINIGANAENVFLKNNEDSVQDFIDNTMPIYKTGILLQSSSPANIFEKYKAKTAMFDIDNTIPCFLGTEIFTLRDEYPYTFFVYIRLLNSTVPDRIGYITPYEFTYDNIAYTGFLMYGQYPNNQGNGWYIKLLKSYYHSDYIDEHFGHLEGDFVQKTGDTMTGPLATTELNVGTRIGTSAGTNSATVGYSGATGIGAFSQGYSCGANGNYSHAEGYYTTTYGNYSHAEGNFTTASGDFSHAEGRETQTYGGAQHVEGIYNIVDTQANTATGNNYAHIIGNGSVATRSNAHTLDWSGNAWFAGDVYTGSTSGTNKDAGSKKLATEEYVNTNGGKIDSISIDGVTQTIDANKNVALDLSSYESKSNKVISINSSSTDTQYPSAKAVYTAIESLPEPMIFKGTVGRGGTITTLPTNGSANIGDTYKVMLDGTYADIEAKVGDTFICVSKTETSNTWEIIPSGDEPRGTVTSVTLKATSPISINSTAAIIDSGERTISHANSGVTAGTYKSITVNATGHVTAGTNPTTLSGYGITDAVAKAGDTMTGTLKISSGDLKVITGTIHGEDNGTASYTNHAIKLGHSQEDYCDFYEYGGIFNFYKSVSGTNTLLGKITNNGWEGKALLASGSTAVTQATDANNTTIATTAFVKSVIPNIRITNTDPGVGSALSNGNIVLVYEV